MAETGAASHTLTTETKHYPDEVVLVICRGRLVAGTEDVLYATVRALIPSNK
jgi:hypothetical protein